ncbi:MAG: hypothetical protein ACE5H0_09085 [Bacteroidota bacterium]
MYEHILEETERLLEQDQDVIVPVRKIWKQVRQIAEDNDWRMPSLAEFTSILMQDDRIEFMPEQESMGEGDLLEEEREEKEVEAEWFGFYAGQRVKLARIQLTPERLGDMIRRKVDDTMEALMKAWEDRPESDGATEDKLLEVLSRTQKLQREVKEAFSEDKMKSLSEALAKVQQKDTSKSKKKKTGKPSARKNKVSGQPTSSSKRKRSASRRKK